MSLFISHRPTEQNYRAAAELINKADALLITAGAGMGVDSGLPDFRGEHGFYNAYPHFKSLGLSLDLVANPEFFIRQPRLAWGFYAHRYNLYKRTQPHIGYAIIKRWLENKDGFIFTSNVDGHFLKSGFAKDRIIECHGSIHYVQCLKNCNGYVRYCSDLPVRFDIESMTVHGKLPSCPFCGGIARPNILMFNDWAWSDLRYQRQLSLYRRWLEMNSNRNITVVEIGAGSAIPIVRKQFKKKTMNLIRINPYDCDIPYSGIGLKERAVVALEEINKYIGANN